MLRLLIQKGADVNATNIYKNTALLLAVNKGTIYEKHMNLKIVQNELWYRPNFFLGFDKIAEYLIQNGADVNAIGQDGNSVLIWAAYNGKKFFHVFEIVIGHSANNKRPRKLYEKNYAK